MAVAAVREGVNDAVEEQVGQHLAVGARIAVHHDAGRHVDGQHDLRLLQHRPQAGDDLLGRLLEVELPPFGVAAVDRDLLERLDELAGALQVGDQLVGGVAPALQEFVEPRPPQRPRADFAGEVVATPREARRHRQADADRIVDLVRDAGDQAAERGELLGRDQVLLRLAQVVERDLGALLRGAQFVLGLALGDGVLAEHFERARHFADLVARLGAADQVIVFLRDHRLHRVDDLLQRQADAARHQHAEDDDQRQEHDRDQRDVLIDVGERMVEAALRLQLAQRHLRGQLVDHLDHGGLIVVDRGAQQVGAGRELFAQALQAFAERRGALGERAQRGALQVVLGEIDHHRDGLLDGRDAAARLVGGVGGERQVEGVGGDQARGERLARLAERGPEQRVALADRALDDGVEAGHLLGRLEHVVLVGVLDRGLDLAHLAEALQKPLGDARAVRRPTGTGSDRPRRGCAAC